MGVAALVVALPAFVVAVLAFVVVLPAFVVAVLAEGRALAPLQLTHAPRFHERHGKRPRRDVGDRAGEPRLVGLADPEHHVRALQIARLRGAQTVGVRRAAGVDQERGSAHALHHSRHQRMDGRDVGHHVGRGMKGRREQRGQKNQKGTQGELPLTGGRPRLCVEAAGDATSKTAWSEAPQWTNR